MNKGVIISGIGHVGLILWALLGGWLFTDHTIPEIKIVDVSFISSAELDAMTSSAPAVATDAPAAAETPADVTEPVATPPSEPDVAPADRCACSGTRPGG